MSRPFNKNATPPEETSILSYDDYEKADYIDDKQLDDLRKHGPETVFYASLPVQKEKKKKVNINGKLFPKDIPPVELTTTEEDDSV